MSSFPTDTFTGDAGDLDVYIPAVWGAKINDFAKNAKHFSNFFTDRSDELVGGGNIVYTPGMTEMAAASKTVATAVTLNSPTETAITLTVSNWYEVSFAIEDKEAATYLKSYNVQERYAKNAGYTAAMVLETAIAALFSSFTSSVGASTTAILESDIFKAVGTLTNAIKDTDDISSGNFGFFIENSVFWRDVATMDLFKLNVNSPVADPAMKPPVKHILGIPVYTSTRVPYVSSTTGRINVLAHKDAIHYALAKLPRQNGMVRVQSNYIPEYLSTVTTADLLYGVAMNRPTWGVKMYSSKNL